MAHKLTYQEEQTLLNSIIELTRNPSEYTTSTQLSKKLNMKYPDSIERISLKYNVPNILHGQEAKLFNRRIAASKSVITKLSKLEPQFRFLLNQGKSLIDIQEEMGIGLDQFCSLCEFCSIDKNLFLSQYSIRHDVAVATDEKGKNLRARRIADRNLANRQKFWLDRCLLTCDTLRSQNIPITLKQISIQLGYIIFPEDMIEFLKNNIPDIIVGAEADKIDKDLMHKRQSNGSKRSAKQTYETIKKRNQVKYGVDCYFQTKEFQEKSRASKLERYGDENYNNREKSVETLQEKYKVSNVHQIPEVVAKSLETWNERYGKCNPQGRDMLDNRIRQNTLDKYGVKYPCLTKRCMERRKVCFRYQGISFDSSHELCYYIWAKDHNLNIERYSGEGLDYESFDGLHKYFPDFIVDGRYIEVKGSHFFNEDGILYNPYTKDETIQSIWKAKQIAMNDLDVEIISDGETYIKYVSQHYSSEYASLFRIDSPFPYSTVLPKKTNDKEIIRYFHRSIYSAHVGKYPSPIDAWNDKDLVKKSADNRLTYIHRCTAKDVIIGFNVAKIAPKVSVFSANYADMLIKKYLNDAKEIFDPFSGFSGRLLGSRRNSIRYIGQDISQIHVDESNEIINYIESADSISVICKDIFNCDNESYDTLFTCPPYGLKEIWEEPQVDLSCDEWIDECIKRFHCRKYLFVVDNTMKYSSFIVEEKENKSHLGLNIEKVVLINYEDLDNMITSEQNSV